MFLITMCIHVSGFVIVNLQKLIIEINEDYCNYTSEKYKSQENGKEKTELRTYMYVCPTVYCLV